MQSPEYNYLKRSRRSVYRVIAEHDKGRIFEFAGEWRHMGRPKIMKNDEVDLFTESVHKNLAPLMGCPPPLARGGVGASVTTTVTTATTTWGKLQRGQLLLHRRRQ